MTGTRPLLRAMLSGFARRCPACGHGRLFDGFLKVADTCGHCGLDLTPQRADDAPPYFTILIVGHVVIPACLLLEQMLHPAAWVHFAIWLPVTVAMTAYLLPRTKGTIIGVQWSQRMHGFGPDGD